MENSGAIVAHAAQQPSFPPDSAPAAVPAAIPVEISGASQPAADVRPPSVLPDAVRNPSAAPAPISSPIPSDSTRKSVILLPILVIQESFLLSLHY